MTAQQIGADFQAAVAASETQRCRFEAREVAHRHRSLPPLSQPVQKGQRVEHGIAGHCVFIRVGLKVLPEVRSECAVDEWDGAGGLVAALAQQRSRIVFKAGGGRQNLREFVFIEAGFAGKFGRTFLQTMTGGGVGAETRGRGLELG